MIDLVLLVAFALFVLLVLLVLGGIGHSQYWRGVRRGIYLAIIDARGTVRMNGDNLGDQTVRNMERTTTQYITLLTYLGWDIQITAQLIVAKKMPREVMWADVRDSDLLDALARLYCDVTTTDIDTEDAAEWAKVKTNYLPQSDT